jgi:hypothetical protein
VELSVNNKFTIFLKQGDLEPYNISGSLYLVKKLKLAQCVDCSFKRANHGKREMLKDSDLLIRKRLRI